MSQYVILTSVLQTNYWCVHAVERKFALFQSLWFLAKKRTVLNGFYCFNKSVSSNVFFWFYKYVYINFRWFGRGGFSGTLVIR
jgi:hypothetical protein